MKSAGTVLLAILLSALSLSGCVTSQRQDAASSPTANTINNANDTNYQNMVEEETARTQALQSDTHPHVGGRR